MSTILDAVVLALLVNANAEREESCQLKVYGKKGREQERKQQGAVVSGIDLFAQTSRRTDERTFRIPKEKNWEAREKERG